MKKNRLWIILFGVIVLAYGISQQWQEQRSDAFVSVLLDFVPQDVSRIDIHKADDTPFSLIHNQNRWLLSQEQLNEEIAPRTVEKLMRILRDIRTSTLVSQDADQWSECGVNQAQGTLICLRFKDTSEKCVRIGKFTYSQARRKVQAYARLDDQKEVFTINGMGLSSFTGEMEYFRRKKLVSIDAMIDSMVFVSDSLPKNNVIILAGVQYISHVTKSTIYWQEYANKLRHLEGEDFVDDIDELSMDSLEHWRLKLYYQTDSVVLTCYRDTNRQQPYLLHSSQFPAIWLSSDSTGLYRKVALPWEDPSVIPSERIPVHTN